MRISRFALAALAAMILVPSAPAQDGSSSVRFAWVRMQERNRAKVEAAHQAHQEALAHHRERREQWAATQREKLARAATRRAVIQARAIAATTRAGDSATAISRRRRNASDEVSAPSGSDAVRFSPPRRRARRPGTLRAASTPPADAKLVRHRARRAVWASRHRDAANGSAGQPTPSRRRRALPVSPAASRAPRAPRAAGGR